MILRFLLAVAATMAMSASTAYGQCFNSTAAILEAQIGGTKDIVICPNTIIDIGVPTDLTFANFAGGDIPLSVIGDNVTIKCGDDGKSTNKCVLNGGFVQFVTSAIVPQVPGVAITTNNMLIQGLTFTGELVQLPGAGEIPISLSAPGTNMVFDDIVMENLRAMSTFSLAQNVLIPEEYFPDGSASVTLQNSVLRNISFAHESVKTFGQTLIMDGVVFEHVYHDSSYISPGSFALGTLVYANGVELQVLNSNFTDVSFRTSVVVVRGETEYEVMGNTGSGWIVDDDLAINETMICTDGLIVATSAGGTLDLSSDLDSCLPLLDEEEGEPTDPPSSASAMLTGNGISSFAALFGAMLRWWF